MHPDSQYVRVPVSWSASRLQLLEDYELSRWEFYRPIRQMPPWRLETSPPLRCKPEHGSALSGFNRRVAHLVQLTTPTGKWVSIFSSSKTRSISTPAITPRIPSCSLISVALTTGDSVLLQIAPQKACRRPVIGLCHQILLGWPYWVSLLYFSRSALSFWGEHGSTETMSRCSRSA